MKTRYPVLITIFSLFFVFLSCNENALDAKRYPLIPRPVSLESLQGDFLLTPEVRIVSNSKSEETGKVISFLKEIIEPATGFVLRADISQTVAADAINLILDESMDPVEGAYKLDVTPLQVNITSATTVGLFYGVQTLRQLLPVEIESEDVVSTVEWRIPAVSIEDKPRFTYRGMHLDVGRHFFPVSFIKKYIDLIAFHKMNTFHWHLTEDQGWRIEIKKYPKLTEIGAWRDETLIGHGARPPFEFDGERYGGFYTQEEIKEVVAYAASRFVTIIPEIEMPGHSMAALAAYPELGCTGGPYEVATRWGVFDEVYCAGNDETFAFMEDVLTEVIDLFPGTYIHIGGDECPKKRWKDCDRCQARIKEEKLADEHELQSYFIRRIEKFLLSKNRKLIGWDEILEGGLAPSATVMSWRGVKGGIEAAKQGHDVIMTPNDICYLDHYQNDPLTEPLAIGGFTSVKDIYTYEPVPDTLTAEESKYILGAQGNVWTEYIKTPNHAEYMAFPRACALAEINWLPQEKKNWPEFMARLRQHYKRLNALDVNYFEYDPDIEAHQKIISFQGGAIKLFAVIQ